MLLSQLDLLIASYKCLSDSMDGPDTRKQTVRVTIFNQTYSIASLGDPQETEDLARTVDDLMSSIARQAGNLDTSRTAVLACLHLADQLRAAQEELDKLRTSVARKTRSLANVIDHVLSS